jgi:hypothetical protein
MLHAAVRGRVEMINQLISLGIPAKGLKLVNNRLIYYTIRGRYLDFVRRQIELGANVNECIG